jgi:hypothetical protein
VPPISTAIRALAEELTAPSTFPDPALKAGSLAPMMLYWLVRSRSRRIQVIPLRNVVADGYLENGSGMVDGQIRFLVDLT